jgi:hypothetical protein
MMVMEANEMTKTGASLVGWRFNRYTVLLDDGTRHYTASGDSYRVVTVQCECPAKTIKIVRRSHLITGHTKSCGCLNEEQRGKTRVTHGKTGTPEYRAWANMKRRCLNKNHPDYPDWGARGIKICARWRKSFENFLADMGPKPKGTTLNRIDNDGDYVVGNCEWTTNDRQSANKRYAINHSSGQRGVQRVGDKWRVVVAQKYIGQFPTKAEAVRVANWKYRQLYGDDLTLFQEKDPLPPDYTPPHVMTPIERRAASIAGNRYGHLLVREDDFTYDQYGNGKQKSRTVLVECDCGTIKWINRQAVIDGRTKTCGHSCPFKKRRSGPYKKTSG